jgi:hypothetical protein
MFAGASSAPPVGGTGENPYTISVNHLITSFQPSVRVVLRRGAQILTDNSVSGSSSYASFTTRPLPGDVVDVYRPQGAATPAFSATIPQMSGKFDPVADLAAIDAPAAGEEFVYPCRLHGCPFEIPRIATDRPAGRTIFDFAHSQGGFAKVDLRPDDATNGFWIDPTFTLSFGFALTAGDLVAPAQSFKLPTKLKISTLAKALKKGYKIKLTSNEAGSAKLKLGKLASVTGSVKPGSNSLKLKFSKSGKKAIKKLAAQGKHAKSRSISLTSVVTDASGNASTIVKKTKLKP